MHKLSDHKLLTFLKRPIVRYVIVGGVSFLADYSSLLLLYRGFILPLALSTIIAFIIGLLLNFLMNRAWSFKSTSESKGYVGQFSQYIALVAINTLITSVLITYAAGIGIGPEISKPLVMAVILGWNYLIYSRIIFRAPRSSL